MYHYVRPLKNSRYPKINGLEVDQFREQLAYLKRHYTLIGMDALLDAIVAGAPLPPRACLLSFDDGYADHYQYVFPILCQEKVSGAFYPPCSTLQDRLLLDVNKIHFILASEPDKGRIETSLDAALLNSGEVTGAEIERLKKDHRVHDHLDTAEVVYIKHALQFALPEDLRHRVVDRLFSHYVSADETAFAEELYLSEDQAKTMVQCGMHFGGHGDHHYWLSRLPDDRKAAEVDRSTQLLTGIGMPADKLTFCYPYGDYDQATQRVLEEKGYCAAVTTEPGVVDLSKDAAMALPRLDTNDLPRASGGAPNRWTLAA